MNTRLLRRIQRHILEEPKRVDMIRFIARRGSKKAAAHGATHGLEFPECGTVGCIAGWAATFTTSRKFRYNSTGVIAAKALKLSCVEAEILFFEDAWPDKFKLPLWNLEAQTPEYARVVSDRIEHFIKTKGRE